MTGPAMSRDKRLAGRTALVTGSTRGIGRTIAERLGREGARVVVSGRVEAEVATAVADMRAIGLDALGVAADLSRPEEAHRLGTGALAAVDHLDILVNNAGQSRRGAFWDVEDADWEYQMNLNLRAPFILAQHAARSMIERGVHGRIVNIGSIGARHCHRDAAVYDAAKSGVEALTRNLAYELGPHGISVNCVVPGSIADRPGAGEARDEWQRASRFIPIGRIGRADDVAAAVLWFSLPEAEFTTGQSLLVDGGQGAYLPEE
ncbi:MAG: glucose 1-dehydrogenase [Chloroflexota bacterium]|jgi:NAD(P)-dependent dehydrogenase (short-subunit alcohol dehydrogenase family)|nr:glucose 1-dehydrogenase [Chloroflexota bacterium]